MPTQTRDQTAARAEADTANNPGMCLQWSRECAGIGPRYPDATTAWHNATQRRIGSLVTPPRGVFVYWTGGARGFGHIAVSLGNGLVRSSDAGGSGRIATVRIAWVEQTWGHRFAGWADNVNGVTLEPNPPIGEPDMDADDTLGKWSPDGGEDGALTVGKTLNQARGFSEDAYKRIRRVELDVAELHVKIDQILEAIKRARRR